MVDANVDLFAKFEVGQGSENLFAKFLPRYEASQDLKALPLISAFGEHIIGSQQHSAENEIFGSQFTLSKKAQVSKIVFYHEHDGAPDNQAEATIYAVASGKPGAQLAITNSVALTVGFNEMDIVDEPELDPDDYFLLVKVSASASGVSRARYETTGSGTKGFTKSGTSWSDPMTGGASRSYEFTVYAVYSLVSDATVDLKATFEVLQGAADLFADFTVGQWQEELFAKFQLPERGEEDLKALFFLPEGLDLYAKFETQAVLNLVAEFTVRHPSFRNLLGFFRVNNYSVELKAKFEVRQAASQELFTKFLPRRSASRELKAIFDSAPYRFEDLKAVFSVRRTATRDLYAKFELQASADLKCVIQWVSQTGLIPDVTPIIGDYIAQWLNYTQGEHRGFISEPTIQDDPIIKDEGANSCKIESVYEAHKYKEITFGWTYNDADYGPGGSQAVDPSAGGIVYANSPVQSRDDRANYIRRAGSNNLLAGFYVMANQLDFPSWQDLGRPGAWWEWLLGTAGQTNPQADYIEAVIVNYANAEENVNGAWHYVGTRKTYLGGTIAFDLQFTDPYVPGAGLMGTQQTAGLILAREMQYDIYGHSMVIRFDSRNDIWYFTVANEDGATHVDISAFADFEQRHVYRIVWEVPSPPPGRVRLYIDDILWATVTTNVNSNRLVFGFGADVARIGAKMRSGARLYSYSDV